MLPAVSPSERLPPRKWFLFIRFFFFVHWEDAGIPGFCGVFGARSSAVTGGLFSHSTSQASCLADEPKQIGLYKYPERLPGQLYDADTQCKWQFGSRAKLCNLGFVKVTDCIIDFDSRQQM